MIDLDHLTILGMPFRVDDLAARGRDDRGSGFSGKIDSFVKRILARERIDAVAEIRREPAVDDRLQRRHEARIRGFLQEQRFQNAELIRTLLHVARNTVDQRREFGHRKRVCRHRRFRTAGARHGSGLQRSQFVRFEARDLGEPLAQAVETHHPRLQLAQPHRHRVQVTLHARLRPLRFLALSVMKLNASVKTMSSAMAAKLPKIQ